MSTTSFNCVVCFEDSDGQPFYIDGSGLCETCIQNEIIPQFHEALKFEIKFPVVFGHTELFPRDFEDFFGDYEAFAKSWKKRIREYDTPPKERVYCAGCDGFVCRRARESDEDAPDLAHCENCDSNVCNKCGNFGHLALECDADLDSNDTEEDMEGCKRCPNQHCGVLIALRDGCNHVHCEFCGQGFCWVCLEKDPKDDHWARDSACPRYNQPGANNAHFDNDDEADDEDVEAWAHFDSISRLFHAPVEEQRIRIPDLVTHLNREAWATGETIIGDITDLTLLSHLPLIIPGDLTPEEAIRIESEDPVFVESEAAAIMSEDRAHLEDLLQILDNDPTVFEANGVPVAALRRLINALRANLDIFTWRTRLMWNLPTYNVNHAVIVDALRSVQANEWLRSEHEVLFEVLTKYLFIAHGRFTAATRTVMELGLLEALRRITRG
jgi:hypothetical protein